MTQRVLVVDDQKTIRDLLTDVLESAGYLVTTASDGKQGVRALFETKPDLVITDLFMPGMDGNEFSKLVRMACDAPIIMLTAVEQVPHEVLELNLFDDYLVKPVRVDTLLGRVEALLGNRTPKIYLLPNQS